jgi:3-phosphoshikimate 1-carboxyvinyltransferase
MEGELTIPGDKSISHRALILNAIAHGSARVKKLSFGHDTLATISCLKALGVSIELKEWGAEILGVGHELKEPNDVLQAENSGTTIRFLTGLLCAQPHFFVITGDASLRSRPMERIIEPLRLMGAQIWGRGKDRLPPLAIRGQQLKGIEYHLPPADTPAPFAQIKSSILLAGLFATGETVIIESVTSRDHTERLLLRMGASIKQEGERVSLKPLTSPLTPLDIEVPGDISSAAFFLVAGAIHPRAHLRILGVGINPTRTGLLDVMRSMGANFKTDNVHEEGGETVADIEVTSSDLQSVEFGAEIIHRLIDEIPVIAVAATQASGATIIRGAAELRFKESDRITTTVNELNRMGAKVEELPDGLVIHGPTPLVGTEVNSHGDHRLAMALTVAAMVAKGETIIMGGEATDVSYPSYFQDMNRLITSQ